MKIKVPPYPNYLIAEEAFQRDIVLNSRESNVTPKISDELILVAEFNSGGRRVLKSKPIKYKGRIYVAPFPNPVHILLSSAIEQFNASIKIQEISFVRCGKNIKQNKELFFLDAEESGTHECYNNYMKYRIGAIIMLVASIEAFINHIIPNDFIYSVKKKNKTILFNKKDIESIKVSFRDKLCNLIPQYLEDSDFWTRNILIQTTILDLYKNRKNMIHLKTNSEDDLKRYFSSIGTMLEFDIEAAINSVIKFMNSVSKDFIEFTE